MIRATNTIKHLDVKPCLFEDREEALKKSRPQQGVIRKGDQTLTISATATHLAVLCVYLCMALL